MIALFTDLADEGAVAGLEALPKVFKRWVNRLHPFCSNGFWHCAVGGRHRAGLQHSLGAAKQRHRSDFALKCSGRFVAVCDRRSALIEYATTSVALHSFRSISTIPASSASYSALSGEKREV